MGAPETSDGSEATEGEGDSAGPGRLPMSRGARSDAQALSFEELLDVVGIPGMQVREDPCRHD